MGPGPPYTLSKYTIIKDYRTLGVRYRDLQARVYNQETRNLRLHEAQPTILVTVLKSLNFTKTKLYEKTPHAAAPFVLMGVASETIVPISSKVKIINFYSRPLSCRAIKISCTILSHDRVLLSCK